MRTFPDHRMPPLLALLGEGRELAQAGDSAGALAKYRSLVQQLQALGLTSAWVQWALAIVHDTLEDFPMALSSIRSALELDPLDPGCRNSFEVITRRIREHLHGLPVADASIPRLYRLIQEAGDVDVPTHLVVVRHYAATARPEKAEALLEALCMLAPAAKELWRERARLAQARGDATTGAQFEAEAQLRAGQPVPYSIPEPREA
jgi:tetratricopeptide (TPR) repeat protein